MSVTFIYESSDPRQRSVLNLASVDAAVNHVCAVMNGGKSHASDLWTFDADGEIPITNDALCIALSREEKVVLYDQGGHLSDDRVVITRAWQ